MAGARKVEFDCDGSFAEAARLAVEVRSAEVFAHADDVLDTDDVERVHDMRVATRRLRAALEVFEACFPHKRHRKALKRVRTLADALGERRDADVEIELLEGFLDEVAEADRDTLRVLIGDLREQQLEANERLAPYVAAKRLRKLRRRLKKLARAAGP